jgi:hypothetical protein
MPLIAQLVLARNVTLAARTRGDVAAYVRRDRCLSIVTFA